MLDEYILCNITLSTLILHLSRGNNNIMNNNKIQVSERSSYNILFSYFLQNESQFLISFYPTCRYVLIEFLNFSKKAEYHVKYSLLNF